MVNIRKLDCCVALRAPSFLKVGKTPPFLPPFSTPWRPAAAVAPSGKFLAKKKKSKFFWGGDPPSLPPPLPLTPPLQHPLAACSRSGPFEGVFGEKTFWVNFFGGVGDPPSLPPPPAHPGGLRPQWRSRHVYYLL